MYRVNRRNAKIIGGAKHRCRQALKIVHVDDIGALSPEHVFHKCIRVRIPHVNSVPDWLDEEGLFRIVIRRVEVQRVKPIDSLSLSGLGLGSCARVCVKWSGRYYRDIVYVAQSLCDVMDVQFGATVNVWRIKIGDHAYFHKNNLRICTPKKAFVFTLFV